MKAIHEMISAQTEIISCHKTGRYQKKWTTDDVVSKMYTMLYTMFVEAGVAIRLSSSVSCNKDGQIVKRVEEACGLPSEYGYAHPDYVLFFDEVGDKINMKDNCALGGKE